ncbi:APC family permease [Roseiconus lacunae]|uniref:APC family permease n=1 Tax=Roseiconus lacunae TaxID=2605694 RepID=A0ABT7PCE2_9BACT|nr:APC family permease [Roseiconus lacunae]MDM4014169.1 APC family permease [Roseiconus lacunae]
MSESVNNPFEASHVDQPRDDVTGTVTPTLGPFSAGAIVAASMIGAGVYTTSGWTLADLGSPTQVVLAWAIGGAIAICGAICYGGLAQRFTESGGEYLFLARAVHPSAGMMAGWVSLLAGFAGAMAFAASTFESYLRETGWPALERLPERCIAIGLVLIAASVHSVGLHPGTRVQNAVVVMKFMMIGLFIMLALANLPNWEGFTAHTDSNNQANSATPVGSIATVDTSPDRIDEAPEAPSPFASILAFANALTWISLSYSGFNAAVYMTGEIKNPRRNVPRAMLYATLIVTVIYVALNAIFVFAPAAARVTAQPNVATAAAAAIGEQLTASGSGIGRYISPLVRIAILTGLATSVLALTQTGPRVYQKMASDGLLPSFLRGHLGDRHDGVGLNLRPAILTQAVLGCLVIGIATLRQQLDYLGLTLSVCAALCGALVFVVHRQDAPVLPRWAFPWVPVVYVFGTLMIATLTAVRVPVQGTVGLGTLSLGVIAYWLSRLLWGSRASGDRRN